MSKGVTGVIANESQALRVELTYCNPDGVAEEHKDVLTVEENIA